MTVPTGKASNTKKSKTGRTRLSANDRRSQLLKFAVSETAKNGIGQARHAEIAGLAGVAVSTVFFYFPTVEELDRAVLDNVIQGLESSSFRSSMETGSTLSFFDLFDRYIKDIEIIIEENKDYFTIFLMWGTALNHPTWNRYLKFRQQHIDFTTKILIQAVQSGEVKSSINIDSAAILVVSSFRMIYQMTYYGDSEAAIEELCQCIIEHLKA